MEYFRNPVKKILYVFFVLMFFIMLQIAPVVSSSNSFGRLFGTESNTVLQTMESMRHTTAMTNVARYAERLRNITGSFSILTKVLLATAATHLAVSYVYAVCLYEVSGRSGLTVFHLSQRQAVVLLI